jgi:hypothetical protein
MLSSSRGVSGRPSISAVAMRVGVLVGIAVAGGEPHDDLVARGDRAVADRRVDRGRAAEEPHRRGEAQQLVDRRADQRGVRAQALVLLRVLGQRLGAQRDRLAGGLVAGHDHQREHVVQLARRQRPVVDLRGGDAREHVVAGALAPLGVVGAAQRAQLLGPWRAERLVAVLVALAAVGQLADVGGIGVDQQAVAELDQARQLLVGQPEDLAQHPDRDRRRQLVDEVELPLRQRPVHERHDQRPQPLLVAVHRPGREARGDQAPVAAVLGRVELEEVAPRLQDVLGQVLDRRRAPDLRRERLGVAQHGVHVGVLRHRPEAAPVRLGMEVDGRLALEQLEDLPRLVVCEKVVVE